MKQNVIRLHIQITQKDPAAYSSVMVADRDVTITVPRDHDPHAALGALARQELDEAKKVLLDFTEAEMTLLEGERS